MLRPQEIELINNYVNKSAFDPDCKRIIHISGIFGTGKSWLVNNSEELISKSHSADAIFRLERAEDMGLLHEFLNNAILTFKAKKEFDDNQFNCDETEYNMKRYLELLNLIKEKDNYLFEEVLRNYVLKSDSDILITESLQKQTKDYKNLIDSEIVKIIELKGDVRLLLESSKVVAESFIVDLMNFFYSIQVSLTKPDTPKKLVIIIDNYDLISGSINQWLLEYFFHYCFTGKFNEFISYSINLTVPDLKVSDFFDFRFIIAERDRIFKDENDGWNRFKKDTLEITLKPLNEEDTQEYIDNFDSSVQDEILKAPHFGIPYILELLKKYYSSDSTDKNFTEVYKSVYHEIIRYKNESQKEWLQAASFLNSFDYFGLRCFPQMNKNYKEAFAFFEHSSDIAFICSEGESRLQLFPVIKEFVRETVSIQHFTKAKDYKNISRIYNAASEELTGLSLTEIEIIRNLAYFRRFDEEFALNEAYDSEAQNVRIVLLKFEDWFIKTEYTYSLKPEKYEILNQLNKLADQDFYYDKEKLVKYIWDKRSKTLITEVQNNEALIPEMFRDIASGEKESAALKQSYDELQRKFISQENELIDYRKKLSLFTNKRNLTAAITNFFIGIAVLALAYIFPDIFPSPENHDAIVVIQLILYITTSVFTLVGLVNLIKALLILTKKKELKILTGKIKIIEDEKAGMNDSMKELKEQKDNLQKRITELNSEIKQLHNVIQLNRQKLAEPFFEN